MLSFSNSGDAGAGGAIHLDARQGSILGGNTQLLAFAVSRDGGTTVNVPWITYDGAAPSTHVTPPQQPVDDAPLVEAQGIVVADGTIRFVVDVATATPHSGLPATGFCAAAH